MRARAKKSNPCSARPARLEFGMMIRRQTSIWVPLTLSLFLAIVAGCEPVEPPASPATLATPTAVVVKTSGVTPRVDYSPLAKVLQGTLTGNGRVDMYRFRRNGIAKHLDQQIQLLAVTGPTATPTLFSTLTAKRVYWLNARATWAVKLLTREENPAKANVALLRRTPFPLDGRTMTLPLIDKELFAIGGKRAVLAAPGVSMQRAPLQDKPFTSESPQALQAQLAACIDDFIATPARFHIDIENQTLRVPPVFWRYRQSFLDAYHREYGGPKTISLTTALLPAVDGLALQRLQRTIGYTCVEDTTPTKPAAKN